MIELWNKIDLVPGEDCDAILTRAQRTPKTHVVSAVTGEGLDAALAEISASLDVVRTREVVELGFADGRKRAWLFEQGVVESEAQTDDGYRLHVFWTPTQEARFGRL